MLVFPPASHSPPLASLTLDIVRHFKIVVSKKAQKPCWGSGQTFLRFLTFNTITISGRLDRLHLAHGWHKTCNSETIDWYVPSCAFIYLFIHSFIHVFFYYYFDILSAFQGVGSAEAVSWEGLYWVVCHCLPALFGHTLFLLNAECEASKEEAHTFNNKTKKKSLVWLGWGLNQQPTRLRTDTHIINPPLRLKTRKKK